MEGPQFSTKAESELHRSWGAGLIGMTAIPEAKLAREAEMCYTMIAFPTDYDCWKEEEAAVDVPMFLQYAKENNKTVNILLPKILGDISYDKDCSCYTSAQNAFLTNLDFVPIETKRKLELLYGNIGIKINIKQ